jgi:probable HAF family extracellular repeat protein
MTFLKRTLLLGLLMLSCGNLVAGTERTANSFRRTTDPQITITDLGVLPGAQYATAIDINNNGQIVGYSGGFPNYCCGFIAPLPHGFLWDPATGGMYDIGVPMVAFGGGISSYGYSLNDAGLIAGYARAAYFDNIHYLLTTEASTLMSVPAWNPSLPSTWTMTLHSSLGFTAIPEDVNEDRVIVGKITSAPQKAFIWTSLTGTNALPVLEAGPAAANGINDSGTIVGWGIVGGRVHPLRWDAASGIVEDLGLPAGWVSAQAEDVNASGTVTGFGTDVAGNTRSFVWTDTDGFTFLPTLGGNQTFAQGINASGKVVGYGQTSGGAQHAFAWDPATGLIVDLGTLAGDGISNAYAINDRDEIVGRSLGVRERAVLWTVTFETPDVTAPEVTCETADGIWHAADVSLACTAIDTESGLADEADASFVLATSVAAGTETANALTSSRSVCDVAGNCVTVGPLPGSQIDKLAPSITLDVPAAATYVLNQAVAASFTCADGGSGVAACEGPVANGANIDTATAGVRTFAVQAADAVGNSATSSRNYTVAYGVCVQYDQSKAHKAGSTVPIKVQLCDANGANVSSPGIALMATGVYLVSNSAPGSLEDSGNANPDYQFRFDTDRYIFNLSLKGFSQGTYALTFTAGADPTTHAVRFQVK